MSSRVSGVANVIIPVDDQDRALAFYTEELGFEKRADLPFGDGNRWIEVAPPAAPGDADGVRSGVRHRSRTGRVREGGRVNFNRGAMLDL